MTSYNIPAFSAASQSGAPEKSARASSWALGFSLLALIGGIVAMVAIGVSVAPMEAASGYYFSDTPLWYQVAVLAGFGSLLIWTVAGLAGIALAVLGLRAGRGRARAICAIVLALLAPVLTLVVLLAAMGTGIALL